MLDNEVIRLIAQKIRTVRQEKNLTLQEVAKRSHVSKGLLSKIENSRTIPSLPVFISLIQSLDLSLKDFFREMVLTNGKNYLHVKRAEALPLQGDSKSGFRYHYLLSQNISNGTMEAMLVTIEPGAKGTPTIADGYAFRYILRGSCNYMINNEKITLAPGDALYMDASIPHVAINHTQKKVEMLSIYFMFPKV